MADNLKNGMVLGAITGFLLTYPKVSSWVADFLAETVPASWQVLGTFSIPVYGIALGIIVGYIIDKR